GHDLVLLAVELAGLLERRVQVGEVRDQRRVPRLDGAQVEVVLNVANLGMDDVPRVAAGGLGQSLLRVRKEAELRVRVPLGRIGAPEGLDLEPGPLVGMQDPGLGLERRAGRRRGGLASLRCRGDVLPTRGQDPCPAGDRQVLQERPPADARPEDGVQLTPHGWPPPETWNDLRMMERARVGRKSPYSTTRSGPGSA